MGILNNRKRRIGTIETGDKIIAVWAARSGRPSY